MRKFFKWFAIFLLVLAGIAAFSLWGVWKAAQQEPEFYHEVLVIEPEVQKQASAALETRVTELQEEVRRGGVWQAEFTEQQINAWLAEELPAKYKNLPKGLSDPRVRIEDGQLQLACRYRDERIATVLHSIVDLELTDSPNEVVVRVLAANAGILPFSLAPWKDRILKEIRKADIEIEWETEEGLEVATIQLPLQDQRLNGRLLIVDELELSDGLLRVAGRTALPEEPPLPEADTNDVNTATDANELSALGSL